MPNDGGETSTTPNSLGGYTPLQEAQLYGLSSEWAQGNVGAGQTIALYELSNYDASRPRDVPSVLRPEPDDHADLGGRRADDTYDDEPTLDIEQAVGARTGRELRGLPGSE